MFPVIKDTGELIVIPYIEQRMTDEEMVVNAILKSMEVGIHSFHFNNYPACHSATYLSVTNLHSKGVL